MPMTIRSQLDLERVAAGLKPTDDAHWANIVRTVGPRNCIDDTQGDSTPQGVRRWAVEQAVALTTACIPMLDAGGKQQGIVGIAATIEEYVLNGVPKATEEQT